MSKEELTDDYEVGYGKPPKNSQFQRGVTVYTARGSRRENEKD